MATSCPRPRCLSPWCGLQMSAEEWYWLLIQQCEVRGHSTAVSELCSSPAIPDFGLVFAVICPCHLKEVRREQYSQGCVTSDVPPPLEMQVMNLKAKWQLRWVWAWSEHLVPTKERCWVRPQLTA